MKKASYSKSYNMGHIPKCLYRTSHFLLGNLIKIKCNGLMDFAIKDEYSYITVIIDKICNAIPEI